MAKIPRRAIDRPWSTGLFIKTNAQATALLAQVAFTGGIHHMRMLTARIDDGSNLGHFLSDNILMLHRQ